MTLSAPQMCVCWLNRQKHQAITHIKNEIYICGCLCARVQYQLSDNLNFCAMLNVIYDVDFEALEFFHYCYHQVCHFSGSKWKHLLTITLLLSARERERVCVCCLVGQNMARNPKKNTEWLIWWRSPNRFYCDYCCAIWLPLIID